MLKAARVLCNAWALCGAGLVEHPPEKSEDGSPKKGRNIHLSQAQRYHDSSSSRHWSMDLGIRMWCPGLLAAITRRATRPAPSISRGSRGVNAWCPASRLTPVSSGRFQVSGFNLVSLWRVAPVWRTRRSTMSFRSGVAIVVAARVAKAGRPMPNVHWRDPSLTNGFRPISIRAVPNIIPKMGARRSQLIARTGRGIAAQNVGVTGTPLFLAALLSEGFAARGWMDFAPGRLHLPRQPHSLRRLKRSAILLVHPLSKRSRLLTTLSPSRVKLSMDLWPASSSTPRVPLASTSVFSLGALHTAGIPHVSSSVVADSSKCNRPCSLTGGVSDPAEEEPNLRDFLSLFATALAVLLLRLVAAP